MNKTRYRQALIEKIGAPVSAGEVTVAGVRTAYLSAGSGAPLLLLHGGGAGAVSWYPTIAPLAKQYYVIAPDIVGYGESDKPDAPYDRPYFAAWLRSLMLAMGIPRAHLVGLSQGGAIALQLAHDHSEMVEKLVLVDSGALGTKTALLPLLGMLWLNIFPSRLANRFFSRYLLFKPEKRDANHGLYSIDVLKRKGGSNAFTQGRGAAVSAMPQESLRSITHETLLIWGEEDRLFPVASGVNAAAIMPNATLCRIQEAGHLPHIDQPARFNAAVIDFLKGESLLHE